MNDLRARVAEALPCECDPCLLGDISRSAPRPCPRDCPAHYRQAIANLCAALVREATIIAVNAAADLVEDRCGKDLGYLRGLDLANSIRALAAEERGGTDKT